MARMVLFLLTALCWTTGCTPSAPVVVVVGILNPSAAFEQAVEGFRQGLADAGYHEGDNLRIVYSGAVGGDGLDAEAAALVARQVTLLFALTTPGAQAAQRATRTIPTIFCPITDPVGAGLVASLDAPGGNMTGVTNAGPTLPRFAYFLELAPAMRRIYVPYDPNDRAPLSVLPDLQALAAERGVELLLDAVDSADAVVDSANAVPADAQGIFLPPGSLVTTPIEDWVAAAVARRLPLTAPRQVEQGVLMSYGDDLYASGQQAARMAVQVLRGARPADLPVETAEFFLSINLQTADAIGLTVPDSLLRQAGVIVRGR